MHILWGAESATRKLMNHPDTDLCVFVKIHGLNIN